MAKRIADLLVLVGPSGVGKSTLISMLMKEFPSDFGYSVSHTTRNIREGEEDGKSYHFVTAERFRELADKHEFLEHAIVHETCYGTSETSVRKVLSENRVCVMDLDIVGAQNLRKHPTLRSLVVFVIPPSFGILEERLRKRGTESDAKIQKRMADGEEWVKWYYEHQDFFDFSFVNDNLTECYDEFRKKIIPASFEVDVTEHSR
jgi:guanylate kinase